MTINAHSSSGKFHQTELELCVVTAKEINGIEMGVLKDGTPFLTGRGLARLCGISNSTLVEWGEFTPSLGARLRAGVMADLLSSQGFEGATFFYRVPYGIGLEISAYPDAVCMSFLEYYAFEAGRWCTKEALDNFRRLARQTLRDFIYSMTGYSPVDQMLSSWRHFHDRLLLNPLPKGYFSVFRETADIVIAAIRKELIVDEHTVPDISVGKLWSEYWTAQNMEKEYGERIKYPHTYPEYFPQAQANGSIAAYVYPLAALGSFRQWLQSEYLPNKFPSYLKTKVKQGKFPESCFVPLLEALDLPQDMSLKHAS